MALLTSTLGLAGMPSAEAAPTCTINLGNCIDNGSCYLNVQQCMGDASCTWNIKWCSGDASCYINLGYCTGAASCLVNINFCAANGACEINAGYCEGDCTVNVGRCAAGASCDINLGTCGSAVVAYSTPLPARHTLYNAYGQECSEDVQAVAGIGASGGFVTYLGGASPCTQPGGEVYTPENCGGGDGLWSCSYTFSCEDPFQPDRVGSSLLVISAYPGTAPGLYAGNVFYEYNSCSDYTPREELTGPTWTVAVVSA